MSFPRPRLATLAYLLLTTGLAGCATDGPDAMSGSGTGGTGGTGGGPVCEVDGSVMVDPIDESACMPLATDYQPLDAMSANDMWPDCVTDDGTYTLVGDSPGSIGRVEGFEGVADLLWRGGVPTADDFTMARAIYAQDQGLESRIQRREDLHYPPVPMEDWDPTVDPDKQCSVTANVEKYPDRCVGPGRMQPILDEAFANGQMGKGDPQVQAARIEATLLWFLYASVYKEANTCATNKGKDCDSSWAYYTGGVMDRDGAVLGLAKEIKAITGNTHSRIFDGVLAARCWRDLYPDDMYATIDDVPADGQDLFNLAAEQLDNALDRGFAALVRTRLEQQAGLTGSDGAANWAFLQIAGPVLNFEAGKRGPADQAQVLADLWAMDCPTTADIEAGVAALDAIFPCP